MDLNNAPPLPTKMDYRIGVLGSGFIVSDCHLVSYRKVGFHPVAIASRTRENAAKAAERHIIPVVYDTYTELLDDPSIEVLDIAVPPQNQFDLIKAACERKSVKGILAQKPLGLDFAQAQQAVELCENAGIVLAVNQNMRYDPSVRGGKTLLDAGALGEPVFATIDMRGVPHLMPWQEELGWVTLRIMSIHHLDCMRYWFGDPQRIYCSTRPDPRTKFPHTDGICTSILEYANGLQCVVIDDIWTGPVKEGCPGDISIKWRIEGVDGLAIGDIGWCKDPYTSPSTLRFATKGASDFHEPVLPGTWFPDAFAGTMGQLLIALETGREPAISGRDNLKTIALVDAAYRSAERHRAVDLNDIASETLNRESSMKLGIINSAFGQAGVDTATGLRHIARIGFDTVDLFAEAMTISPEEKKLIASTCQKENLPIISCVVVATGLIDFNDPVRDYHVERVKKHIDLASEFGAKNVLLVLGEYIWQKEVIPPAAQWGWAIDTCRILGDYADKKKVDIALELEPFRLSLLNNIDEMVRFVDDCKHPRVKANIDVSHLVLADSSPLDVGKLKGKACHVHISDCDGKVHGDLPPGRGVVKFAPYLQAIKELDFDGVVSIELEYSPDPSKIVQWVEEAYTATDKLMKQVGLRS